MAVLKRDKLFGLDLSFRFFQALCMANNKCTKHSGPCVDLKGVRVEVIQSSRDKARCRRELTKHHYLGDVRAVGEQLFYAIKDGQAQWLGVFVFCAAARRLRVRDQWIGWTEEQRRRRLALVVNNCRFLL